MTIAWKFGALVSLAALGLAAAQSASAQSAITFGTPTTISGDSDVSTQGTLLTAIATGSTTTGTATVNGVTFNLVGPGGGGNVVITGGTGYNFNGTYGTPFSGLSTGFQTVLRQNDFHDPGNLGVTLNSLTPGHNYQFQLFVSDPRGATGRQDYIDDGLGHTSANIAFNTSSGAAGNGGLGQFINGTFTAVGSSEGFTVLPVTGSGGVSQINGFQLRDITPTPEPSQAAVFGLGILGLAGMVLKARKRLRA